MLKTVSSITNAIGALNFKGTWDANANNPALASSVGTKGDYYVVGTAGTTNLNGISNWGVGDWATYNGSVWQRVEGGADGNFVNLSATGATNLATVETTGEAKFGTTSSGGSATNTNKAIGGVFTTLHQSGISLPPGANTLFTLANLGAAQTWLVIANCNGNVSSTYHSVAIVRANNTDVSVTSLVVSTLGAISASGLNIQYTQSSGGTQPGGMFFAIRLS